MTHTEAAQHIADLIELTLIPGIGSLAQSRLRAACAETPQIFSLTPPELEALRIPAEAWDALRQRRYREMAQEILDWSLRHNCQLLPGGDPAYPAYLAQIYDPPLLLYMRGCREVLSQPCLAIVGTRRPTPYGLQMAEGMAYDLASRGMAVVSGLARGIDAAGHRGCLDAGGRTIAVLGCGIDVVYPREHRRLAHEIEEHGLLISEFSPGTSPAPQNFPVRNRIISGLAYGALIVEASEYSGSLITARLAMEQNREVFALPGNITSPQSFGPNFLIKQGAKLVQSWRDIVEELPPDLRNEILAKEAAETCAAPQLEMLNDDELKVLSLLETDRATLFDRLHSMSGFEVSKTSNLLLGLEMQGYVRQLPGSLFIRVVRPTKKKWLGI